MKLSFSTLGCPNWALDQIIDRAAEYGFDGIAFRGVGKELDLRKVEAFQPGRIAETRARIEDRGLQVSMVLASARMMIFDDAELAASQAEAKAHIDIAAALGAPFIRVFGGAIPGGMSRLAAARKAGKHLRELGEHAAGTGVTVLFESHDDWIAADMVCRALEAADHPSVAALWDIHHPWRIGEMHIGATWERLRPWVRAIDVKDSAEDLDARLGYRYVKVGEGQVPWADAIRLLTRDKYDGWLTFEWEKRWHPDIDEPEISFPHFVQTMRQWIAAAAAA